MEALKKCEKELGCAAAIELCYDGKIINKMNRYILLGQCARDLWFVDASLLGARHLGEVVENKPASLLVVSLGKALNGRPRLYVEDRCPSFPFEWRVGGILP